MMETITEIEKRIPVVNKVDVLVCGGGVAGFAAAYSAARNGARVLLIERYGFLGGLVTGGLVITVPLMNNGINIELREKLENVGAYKDCNNRGKDNHDIEKAIDPEVFKYQLTRLLVEQNVNLLLHTYIAQTIVEDNTIKGVIIENKAGRQAILANIVVDATGDADITAFSEAPFEIEKTPLPMTMMFNMADVDTEKALLKIGSWNNLRKFVGEAIEKGEFNFDLGINPEYNAPGVYAANLCYPGELNVWGGSIFGLNALNPEELTKAEIVSRDHVMRLAIFLKKNLQGFENSRIEYTATNVGVRETRKITGIISPSMAEIKNKKFNDTVAKPYTNSEMRVPYRSLLPQGVENLIVAGRCISAQHDAMVQLRIIPACLVTGQAAGTAAALALKENTTPRQLDVSIIQKTVTDQLMDLGM
ncbi:FAD-dependent oxidoreductase [Chloroflexota bacterium]